MIEPHRHSGIFIAKGKEDALVTRNMVPGESVYGEKRIRWDSCVYACRLCLHAQVNIKMCSVCFVVAHICACTPCALPILPSLGLIFSPFSCPVSDSPSSRGREQLSASFWRDSFA